jgi:phenylacetate-coenzyme A ligase PaaK-like adenylate-forming protein
MLVSVIFASSGTSSSSLVSGNTWGECTTWAEGTEKTIQSIVLQSQNLILNNISSDESYYVSLKDNVTNSISNYIVYDTFQNLDTWIESLTSQSVMNITYQKRPFVQL